MKNNKNIYSAFKKLVEEIFPNQSSNFYSSLARHLTNFADCWDKNYGISEDNIREAKERTIEAIKQELLGHL